jgi:hypothetical protein
VVELSGAGPVRSRARSCTLIRRHNNRCSARSLAEAQSELCGPLERRSIQDPVPELPRSPFSVVGRIGPSPTAARTHARTWARMRSRIGVRASARASPIASSTIFFASAGDDNDRRWPRPNQDGPKSAASLRYPFEQARPSSPLSARGCRTRSRSDWPTRTCRGRRSAP